MLLYNKPGRNKNRTEPHRTGRTEPNRVISELAETERLTEPNRIEPDKWIAEPNWTEPNRWFVEKSGTEANRTGSFLCAESVNIP